MARPLLFTPITSFSQLRYVYDVAKRKEAIKNRVKTIEINPSKTFYSDYFDYSLRKKGYEGLSKIYNYLTNPVLLLSSSVSVDPLKILLLVEPTCRLNSASNPVPVAV